MPQIAATVTARSRILLQGFLDQAGEAACYCDTDSIYAEKPETFFKTSKDLGGLKLEEKWQHITFAAPKVYHGVTANGEAKGKAKGVSYKDASEVLRFMNGEAVKVKRILGIFETRRRTHKADPISEWASKKAISFAHRRNPNGQAFSLAELRQLGILGAIKSTKFTSAKQAYLHLVSDDLRMNFVSADHKYWEWKEYKRGSRPLPYNGGELDPFNEHLGLHKGKDKLCCLAQGWEKILSRDRDYRAESIKTAIKLTNEVLGYTAIYFEEENEQEADQ
jgi:hypothetical protein